MRASQAVRVVKNPPASAGKAERHRFDPWVRKIPWWRAWQPTPGFLPGESPWTEEPGGLSPQGHTKSDTNETTWPAETHPCCEVSVIVHSTKSFMTATFNTDLSRSALTSVSSQKAEKRQ